jgi:ABC-type amino acid transport substrate-binding protein
LGRGAVGAARAKAKTDVRLVRVRVVRTSESPGRSMTVRVGAAAVDVREGFDHDLLREVVAALGGAP